MFGRKPAEIAPYTLEIKVSHHGQDYPIGEWLVDPARTPAAEVKRGVAAMLRSAALKIDMANDASPDAPSA